MFPSYRNHPIDLQCTGNELTGFYMIATLAFHASISQITDDEAQDLDKHLFAGEEIQEVYDEITKTVTNEHLDFDKVGEYKT